MGYNLLSKYKWIVSLIGWDGRTVVPTYMLKMLKDEEV